VDDCEHLICEIIGGDCSLASGRSRGCRPSLASRGVEPAVLDEVRALIAAIDPDRRDEGVRAAAVRLAAIVRREALDNRHLLAIARDEEPELAGLLGRLISRRAPPV